jgi:exodeoxyribonuclease VII large subunit
VRLARMRQDIVAREARLRGALLGGVTRRQRDLERARGALAVHSPLRALPIHRERLGGRAARLSAGVNALMTARGRHLDGVRGRLDALSPLRVIDRGYSITVDAATGRLVSNATDVAVGAVLRTRLARGSLVSRVLPDGVEVAPGDERMYDDLPGQRATSGDDHG